MDGSATIGSPIANPDNMTASPSPLKNSALNFTDLMQSPSKSIIEDIDDNLVSAEEKKGLESIGSNNSPKVSQPGQSNGIRRGFSNEIEKNKSNANSKNNFNSSSSSSKALNVSANSQHSLNSPGNNESYLSKDTNKSNEKSKISDTVKKELGVTASEPRRRRSIDDLYRDAERRLSRLEKMQQELPSECTFKPNVNHKSAKEIKNAGDHSGISDISSNNGHGNDNSSSASVSSLSHHDKLYHDSIALKQKLEEKSKKIIESEMQQATFKPHITERARRSASPGAGRRHDLLYQKSIEHKELIEKKKEKILQEEKAVATFKPVITERARRSASPGRNRHEELYKTSNVYKERLENKKKEIEKEFSFTPIINHNYPIVGKPMSTPVWERLSSVSKEKNQEQNDHNSKTDREQKPISSIKKNTDTSGKDATWARLSAVHAANKEKLEQLRLQLEKQRMAECTFSPAVTKGRQDGGKEGASDAGSVKESSRSSSSVDPWLRLASTPAKDAHKIEALQQQILQKEKEECTFTPNTKNLGSPTTRGRSLVRNNEPDPWTRLAMPKSSPYPSENLISGSNGSPNTTLSTPPKVLTSSTVKKESFLDRVSRDGEIQSNLALSSKKL